MTTDAPSAGFSLVELLVAMLVTMIISGAVFGLLSAGQGAFRREPELTDRQQNIRLSMDLVQRDLATAGLSVGPVSQVFLTGLNGAIPLPAGPSGNVPDALEMVGSDGQCPDAPVDPASVGGATTTVSGMFNLPACFGTVGVGAYPFAMTQADGTTITWGFARLTGPKTLDFGIPQPTFATYLGNTNGAVTLTRLQLVRYELANDTSSPGAAVPSLFRSATGGLNPLAAASAPVLPTAPGAAVAGWQMVARGIEDFQVRYRSVGAAGLVTVPPVEPVIGGTCNLQVQEVEITIWARALGANLQGQRSDGGVAPAVRGALTSLTTPRVALLNNRGAAAPCTWE